jgi:hypothetical protein
MLTALQSGAATDWVSRVKLMPFRVTACDAGAEFALLTQRMPLKIVALKGGRSASMASCCR